MGNSKKIITRLAAGEGYSKIFEDFPGIAAKVCGGFGIYFNIRWFINGRE